MESPNLLTLDDTQTPLSAVLHDGISAQAARTPFATAVAAGGETISYAQLNIRANQFARLLQAQGVGPEVVVGICAPRSIDMLLALLAILKAGGAYLPIDPGDPAERQSFELQDSNAAILITTAGIAKSIRTNGRPVIQLETASFEFDSYSSADPVSAVRPSNLAYTIYTSGSTGKPKGVMVPHSALMHYLAFAVKEYGEQARRSALVHSSIAFDLTITGLFTPLLVGGCVELLGEENGLPALVEALRMPQTRGIVKITPAHLEILSRQLRPEEAAGKVELFVIGGENLSAASLDFWRKASPSTRLINEYGPTEAAVGCCTYEVRPHDPHTGSVPIGRAIGQTNLYLLDRQGRPVPAGQPGELYIGGLGVARGYHNRPELTRERFLPDPFLARFGDRMYRTGDLARYREDGNLEYLGRLDSQVKIRGYRVEIGEVEAVLSEHPTVRQSVATVREDEPANRQLVAYVIPRAGASVSARELREFLRSRLPDYMTPAHIVFLGAFPLTPNGKIDRPALPPPSKCLSGRSLVQPRNPLETALAAIWAELLGVTPIGIADDFFDLGGHSLLVARLLLRIEQLYGKRLTMAAVFQAPTIHQLAALLEDPNPSAPQIIPVQPLGELPPFFCIGAGPVFRPLATHLGTDRPFLSLMPTLLPELAGRPTPPRLEEIAASLTQRILDYQKTGPYYIGGWSASGVAAYETARQLMEQGREVALLVLFDTANPFRQSSAVKEERLHRQGSRLRFFLSELSALDRKDVPNFCAETWREFRRKRKTAAMERRQAARTHRQAPPAESPEETFYVAVRSYRPAAYPGRIAFFKAAQRPAGNAFDLSLGWTDLGAGNLEIYETPGDHRTMFNEPHVAALAANMASLLAPPA